MGRRAHHRTMNVWANGKIVGQWRIPTRGTMEFQYDANWIQAPEVRPLSLSLPINLNGLPIKSKKVEFYFDNLLPESDAVRRKLQTQFHTPSRDVFDLLRAIGRDCIGAVQLLPEDENPTDIFKISAESLDDTAVENLLANVGRNPDPSKIEEDQELRISLAGVQEKIALTWHRKRWCKPRGSTPTTHIFKLPIGFLGNRQADMRTSVENEWLCSRILAAFGLPVAQCEIHQFGTQKALVVKRFDRQLHSSKKYWLRLPQEDFCQALGIPSTAKYESDGGPSILDIARILQGSEQRDHDLAVLLSAQLIFWMLAATDGHAKNFSLRLLAGGRYKMTPLYDVLSMWPIIGNARDKLDWQKQKLAMALRGTHKHYKLAEIQRRHFNQTAYRCGFGEDMEMLINQIVSDTPRVIELVADEIPSGFPAQVANAIFKGLQASANKLETMSALSRRTKRNK